MNKKIALDFNKLLKLLQMEKPELSQEALKRVMKLRMNIAKDVVSAKAAIDELTHSTLEPSFERNVVAFKQQYQWFRDQYGEYSLIYTTICKMIVTFELSRAAIIEQIKKDNKLPAAFNPNLVARTQVWDAPVDDFAEEAYHSVMEEPHNSKHQNSWNLSRFMRRRFKRYMDRLKPKIYLLRNGSNCRFQDGPNLQDINGMIYVTPWEYEKIQTTWKPIIDYFKIQNFIEEMLTIVIEDVPYGTYGSINYAPDDSGKTRISYCIDPAVQVISKAIHEALDYVVKDIACNGTYRQMALIKNMIKKGYHRTALCISTDMSKYSDTLQFYYIADVLDVIGFPPEVVEAAEDLYTLPMWDSVLNTITPMTAASYQGQYGDFPMITAVNIWNQCIVYDYVNHTYGYNYIVALDLWKDKETGKLVSLNATNSAVGDDTMMIFPNPHKNLSTDLLFEIIRAVFNRCGVNINQAKTHFLDHGKGSCDFVKRVVTKDGLVPYFRVEGICGSFDDQCAELLRFYRDNIIDNDQFKKYCCYFLGDFYGQQLFGLHPINGGVIDRPITEDDLRKFIRRNESLEVRYQNRRDDELRLWFRHMEACGYDLSETALIGFVEREVVIDDSSGLDDEGEEIIIDADDEGYAQYEEYKCTHEDVKKAILHLHRCGFEHFQLTEVRSLIGHTLKDLRLTRPDFAAFLDDYQQSEAYRYMTSRTDHLPLTTYTDMFSSNFLPFNVEDTLVRLALQDDVENIEYYKLDYLNDLIRRRSPNAIQYGSGYNDFGCAWTFFIDRRSGDKYRLYPSSDRSRYSILPFELFVRALQCNVEDKAGMQKLQEIYIRYSMYMTRVR